MKNTTPMQDLIDYLEANYSITDATREQFSKSLKEEKNKEIVDFNDGIRFYMKLSKESSKPLSWFDKLFRK